MSTNRSFLLLMFRAALLAAGIAGTLWMLRLDWENPTASPAEAGWNLTGYRASPAPVVFQRSLG